MILEQLIKLMAAFIVSNKKRHTRFKNQSKVRIFALVKCLEAEITGEDEQQSGAAAAAERRRAAFLEKADHAAADQEQPIWDREAKIMHFWNWILSKIGFLFWEIKKTIQR